MTRVKPTGRKEMMIPDTRIRPLNERSPVEGDYVLYWMQQSQRARWNHALEYAVYRANTLGLPLMVCFGMTDRFPEARERQYRFMLQGLAETARDLRERGACFILRRGDPADVAIALAEHAALMVTDRGYLRIQRQWRERAAASLRCPLMQVGSDVIVPVEEASSKEEFSAGAFRPRLLRKLEEYLLPLKERRLATPFPGGEIPSEDPEDIEGLLGGLDIVREREYRPRLKGGTSEALRLLEEFIEDRLARVPEERNDPSRDCISRLSPYFHFGQLSPL